MKREKKLFFGCCCCFLLFRLSTVEDDIDPRGEFVDIGNNLEAFDGDVGEFSKLSYDTMYEITWPNLFFEVFITAASSSNRGSSSLCMESEVRCFRLEKGINLRRAIGRESRNI